MLTSHQPSLPPYLLLHSPLLKLLWHLSSSILSTEDFYFILHTHTQKSINCKKNPYFFHPIHILLFRHLNPLFSFTLVSGSDPSPSLHQSFQKFPRFHSLLTSLAVSSYHPPYSFLSVSPFLLLPSLLLINILMSSVFMKPLSDPIIFKSYLRFPFPFSGKLLEKAI